MSVILCVFGARNIVTAPGLVRDTIRAGLDAFGLMQDEIGLLIEGGAKGVDTAARDWARMGAVPHARRDADWTDLTAPGAVVRTNGHGAYNLNAGFDRNRRMAEEATHCIGLGRVGQHGGTGHMANFVRSLRKPLFFRRIDHQGAHHDATYNC